MKGWTSRLIASVMWVVVLALLPVDVLALTGSIVINGGAAYTAVPEVTLTLSASDEQTTVVEMQFSHDSIAWEAWVPYSTSHWWTLSAGDGSKAVYVRFRDDVGTISDSYSDTITLDSTAPAGSILINDGGPYAASSTVNLALPANDAGSGVDAMRFSNDGAPWSPWETYTTPKVWALPAGDGTKTVYVQYRDTVGNVSLSYSDTIIVDTTAPVGSIAINDGAAYAGSTAVDLALLASDAAGSGVAEMQFSDDSITWEAWEPYATSRSWTLSSGDGSKAVYVRFRDNVGNVSLSYGDTIVLDTTAPVGSILINDGDVYTGSTAVNLALSASDAGSGMVEMRLSNDGTTWSSWQSYTISVAWSLPAGDGAKTVYVQYRDHVGNLSVIYSDTITLDTLAPWGSIAVDDGDPYTGSTAVDLALSASDAGSGVAQMRFSGNGSAWGAWEPYATIKEWILPAGDGAKTVYVQFQDEVGNVSLSYSDSIVLDTQVPVGSIAINDGNVYVSSTAVTLTLSASDTGSGVTEMRLSDDGSTWDDWEPYVTSKPWTLPAGDGAKTVYVQYQDDVGNISPFYGDIIILDTAAPTGSIVVNDGDPYTGSTAVNLALSAGDAGSGVARMRLSSDGSSWTDWEPYATIKSWILPAGDGAKTVYVQFQDGAGNLSLSYSDTIVLDTLAPAGSIAINDRHTWTNSTAVTLTLSASDAGSGVIEMRLSDDGSTWDPWEPYATSKPWTLPAGDGEKTVYVQYRDDMERVSLSYDDSIVLDTVPPVGSIAINDGDAYASSTAVTLTLSTSDTGSGVTEMRFSDDGVLWSPWQASTTPTAWTLPAGDGAKTVYVQFQDGAGNLSLSYSDTIVLDTLAPVSSASSPTSSQRTSFLVTWSGADAHSGIASYDVLYRVGLDGTWTSWRTETRDTAAVFGPLAPVVVERGQTYYFQVRAADHAGNVEPYPDGDGDTSTYVGELFTVFLPFVLNTEAAVGYE